MNIVMAQLNPIVGDISGNLAKLAEVLRPDVQMLIDRYGFEPAKGWLQS